MAKKPYLHWDPSVNASLYVQQGQGPLVVDAAVNPEDLEWMARKSCRLGLFGDLEVDYIQSFARETGTGPQDGIKIVSSQYMPYGLGFSVGNEPLPLDAADTTPAPHSMNPTYLEMGYRMSLRGFVGSAFGSGYAADVKAGWADATVRNSGDSRGGYTGALTRSVFNLPESTPVAQWAFAALHGKRSTDVDWSYHPCVYHGLGSHVSGPLVVLNSVGDDLVRVILPGGSTSNVLMQRWTGSWVDLFSTTADLISFLPPIPAWRNYIHLYTDLFAGSVLVQPGAPVVWPTSETWFNKIETAQFEPFVVDKSSWGYREWQEHWSWISVPLSYANERRQPISDLVHVSPGADGGPTELRVSDSDLGVCVEFNEQTFLESYDPWDLNGFDGNSISSIVVSDVLQYGYNAPFAMIGRFKFQNMVQWSQTLPVDILVAGTLWSLTPSLENGFGLYWQYTGGQGEGVLRVTAWDDDAGAWVNTSDFQFNAADWDDVPVNLALAWSGLRGNQSGRGEYELRLVINGRTVSATRNPNIRVSGSKTITIGSPIAAAQTVANDRRSFSGLFREAMVFADSMSDEDFRAAWDDTQALDNPSFEIAGSSGRPGEAESWKWDSYQQVGGFAGFNEYRVSLAPWATSFESFGGGFHQPRQWTYEDEAERLAASGFVSSDVGGIALQRSDDTLFILTAFSPAVWEELDIGTNEDWQDTLSQLVFFLFNSGIPLFETTTEIFAIWDFSAEGGEPQGTIVGPPWFDSVTFVQPFEDTLNNASGGTIPLDIPTGFVGWLDSITGSMDYPLEFEEFGEAFGTDPLSTAAGPMWIPGTCVDGKIKGHALDFPVTILPDNRYLYVYIGYSQLVKLELTTGDYDTESQLATMINDLWVLQVGTSTGTLWEGWNDGDSKGISFGWDGIYPPANAWMSMFGRVERNDARSVVGMDSFGAGGITGRINMPAAEIVTKTVGVQDDDIVLLDPWSLLMFDIRTSSYISGGFAIDYDLDMVIFGNFDAFVDPAMIEMYTLQGWFGAAAAWMPSFSGVLALFDSGSTDMEQFVLSNWPDYPYP